MRNDLDFDQPWRIHWRLLGNDPSPVLDRVRECGPLAIILEVQSAEELSPLELPWPNTSFVVVLRGWRDVSDSLPAEGVNRWEFPVRGPEEARETAKIMSHRLRPGTGAFRWLPGRGRLSELPSLLEAALDTGFGVTLPNRPADGITSRSAVDQPLPGEVAALDMDVLKDLAAELGGERIRVHDFILSNIMGLSNTEPAGCEAANALSFLDVDGNVYPCDSLRVRMGSLRDEGLRAIWEKPIRGRIRRDVVSCPPVCSGCDALPLCKGGCRGISFHLKGHFGAPDPLCDRYAVEDQP